jgi:hypothetical protein
MITQRKNESRAAYLMRVASEYILDNCPEDTIDYDETTCDGYCLAEELKDEAEEEADV